MALAIQDFKNNTRRKTYPLTPLAILFQFQTGLRVGDFCTLKTEIDHTGYIFFINSLPLSPHAVNDTLRKDCKQLGFKAKSSHKVRKTVILALIDAEINISAVRELAGHASETTTYRHYCRNRRPATENPHKMERALA
ncbi:MAG: tyrosine-type recombinase/integrase [Firmicutes bacterium]|jgi:integrase|nr:tyrosine-type recombinase/integrase [Bacillota bacterium]